MPKNIEWKSIAENPNLVSSSVLELYKELGSDAIQVVEIDPAFMNGTKLCEEYNLDPKDGANCVIVEAVSGSQKDFVAIVVPVGNRADLNGLVRKYLKVKRISLAPLDKVIEETGMEYGSITPFGLPDSYKILVDPFIMDRQKIIMGGGKQISKILVPVEIFRKIKNVEIVEDLSMPV